MSRVHNRISEYCIQGGGSIHYYFDVKGGQIFENTLFRGSVQTFIHYFDANGAPIFQNTLFRGVQTFIVILMCRVHKYVQNTLFRGVSKH